MRGIYFDGEKACYRENLKIPVPGKDESLVRIVLAAICNTDKEIRKGYRPDFKGVMGHEFVGVVEQSSSPSLKGKRVVGELNSSCGKCIYCRSGRSSHCNSRRVLGIHHKDGCFAEYMVTDTNLLHPIPRELSWEEAIYTEPLAAAFEILTQVKLDETIPVCILGDGRLAYCIAQALHYAGCRTTVIGKHQEKLALFAPFARVTTDREPEAYEVVIEATGSAAGLRQALDCVRKKGTIVLKSTFAGETSLPMSQVAVNEITIIGSRCGPFQPAIGALSEKKVAFPPIELYQPEDFEKAFASGAFKAGFAFGGGDTHPESL